MTPCQKLLEQEGTARWIESMQQSSATPKKCREGVAEDCCMLSIHLAGVAEDIVACSQSTSHCLLVPTVFGMVSSLHPSSFLLIFTLDSLIFLRHWQCKQRRSYTQPPPRLYRALCAASAGAPAPPAARALIYLYLGMRIRKGACRK